jgi:hypothetical protein
LIAEGKWRTALHVAQRVAQHHGAPLTQYADHYTTAQVLLYFLRLHHREAAISTWVEITTQSSPIASLLQQLCEHEAL